MNGVFAILPEGMSSPEKRFLALLPTCRPRLLYDEAHGEGKSIITRPARGEWWCAVTRSVLAVLGDATGMLGTADREGTFTSNEQDVRETPSRTYTSGYCALSYLDG